MAEDYPPGPRPHQATADTQRHGDSSSGPTNGCWWLGASVEMTSRSHGKPGDGDESHDGRTRQGVPLVKLPPNNPDTHEPSRPN